MSASAPPPPLERVLGALARLTANALGATRDLLFAPFEARVARDWVALRLERGLVETQPLPEWLAGLREQPRTLRTALDCLERARLDPSVRGVLVRVGRAGLGWSKTEAVARGLEALRKAGKRVVVFANATGNGGAWLGAQADRFWMSPEGRLDLIGVRVEQPYLRGLLDRIGVRPEVVRAGRFKSVGEILTDRRMSEASREALDALVDDLYGTLVDGLARGRGVPPERVRTWIDEGPFLASEALEAGLVDELVYGDEVSARLAALDDGEAERDEVRPLPDLVYLRLARDRFRWRPLEGAREIAVVTVEGLLRAGRGGPRAAVALLRRLRERESVRAVVLRVDSPGGDPLVSDLIWRGVRRLAERKPVVASLGDTAASGGYYAAMGANEIVCEATTLTGSIGVVLVRADVSGLLEKLGVAVDFVERGAHAGIYDPARSHSGEERALMRRQVERLYGHFVDKAAEGRGLERGALEQVAQGRVWSGRRALDAGLVDRLGGLDSALARARELAGLGPDEGEVVHAALPTGILARMLRRDPIEEAPDLLGGAQLLCPVRVSLR